MKGDPLLDILLLLSFSGLVIGMIALFKGSLPRLRIPHRGIAILVLLFSLISIMGIGAAQERHAASVPITYPIGMEQPLSHTGSGDDPSEILPIEGSTGIVESEQERLDTPVAEPEIVPSDREARPTLTEPALVHFLDVGQGDSILIEVTGFTVLIDGGPRSAGQTVVEYLVRRGIRELDLVIGTHPHEDHIGGLIEVLQTFPVKRVIDSGQPHTTRTFDQYLSEIERQVDQGHCTYEIPEEQIIPLGEEVLLHILGPTQDLGSLNDNSVAARLDVGNVSFLFTGDAERRAEEDLLTRGAEVRADVLKVGHHGSRTSSGVAFLDAVSPTHAVIPVGTDNRYGHPAPEVIERLVARGILIFRTDQQGSITFSTDGIHLSVDREPWHETSLESASEEQSNPLAETEGSSLSFVGSRQSDRYHYENCRHVQSIHSSNLLHFASAEEAQRQGYVPCGACRPPATD